ncbi:MAG: type II secretion system F family protein [Campylobacterales bacterium]|nr:type II secretion system F family protein [Campylobacterales bacterium]
MLFKYRGIDKQGKKHSGSIDGVDKKDATIKLRSRGIFVEKISKQQVSLFANLSFLNKKEMVKDSVLANLSRDLAIYLDSGISIVNAVKLASTQYKKDKKISAFLTSINTLLDEGNSFAVALETQKIFSIPRFYLQSVKISEDGGILAEVLEELSRFIKEMEAISKQIRSNLFYPMFIVAVSILMVAFMITVVVPKITSIFDQMNQELPPVTQFVINASDFLGAYWLVLTIVIFGIFFLFGLAMNFSKGFKYVMDSIFLKLPIFGKTIMITELARFSYMISVLLRSGVPFVQAVSLSANILGNSVLSKVFMDASEKVVEGGKFSAALNSSNAKLPESFVQAIALGEETSELQKILTNLSAMYFEENRDRVGIMLSLLEPMLMLFVGGVVGFIVVSMLLPIFSMNMG